MNNDRFRMSLAVVLSIMVFILFNVFFPNKPVTPIVDNLTSQEDAVAIKGEAEAIVPDASLVRVKGTPVSVEKTNFKITFDSDTGNIISARMKMYTKDETDNAPIFEGSGSLNDYASVDVGILSGFKHYVKDEGDITNITFTASNSNIAVTKTYLIKDGSYSIPISISIKNLKDVPISLSLSTEVGPGLGKGFDNTTYVFTGPVLGNYKKYEKRKIKISNGVAKKGKAIPLASPLWAGYTSKYFLFSFMGQDFDFGYINESGVSQLVKDLTIANDDDFTYNSLSLYVGPKIYDDLKAYNNGIQKTIEYGMFSFIAIPLSKILEVTYSFVGNYGISIIILTIIVKIITLPLTIKSTISMRNMSKLQPEIAAIKEKYGADSQRVSSETMILYKKHNANPLGGCLPLLVQFPIFIALYRTLLVSIELKGAPFFGWLTDLSASDPYYITPILTGISMFITQKMTPSTGDPTQQKMMLMMPVIFTVIFLKMPAGLVVYWLTSNILTIIQQYVMNKKLN